MFICTAQYPHVYLYGTISTCLSVRHNIHTFICTAQYPCPGPRRVSPSSLGTAIPPRTGRERTGTARFLPPRRHGGGRSGPGTRRSGRTAMADARPGYVQGPDGQADHVRFRRAGGDLVGLPQGGVRRLPGSERRSLAHAVGHLPGPRGRCAADPSWAGVAAANASSTADPVDMAGSFPVGPALRMTPSRPANVTMS
jgi:hypothetical protein